MADKPLRDRIIDTALHLFEKYGYHGVTVDRIVAESDTSKGGFYHNFKSKDELLYHIHDVFITYALTKAQEAYEAFLRRLSACTPSFSRLSKCFICINHTSPCFTRKART
ncbi:HTH-type transcriptional regulator QacR [Geobacillus sp. BCO2]|nr:HTH-type transcriptional regulator QacR [Geobacillus sp. BCO2]